MNLFASSPLILAVQRAIPLSLSVTMVFTGEVLIWDW